VAVWAETKVVAVSAVNNNTVVIFFMLIGLSGEIQTGLFLLLLNIPAGISGSDS
jgi:hypothetical protein